MLNVGEEEDNKTNCIGKHIKNKLLSVTKFILNSIIKIIKNTTKKNKRNTARGN